MQGVLGAGRRSAGLGSIGAARAISHAHSSMIGMATNTRFPFFCNSTNNLISHMVGVGKGVDDNYNMKNPLPT